MLYRVLQKDINKVNCCRKYKMEGSVLITIVLVSILGVVCSTPILPYTPDTSNIPRCLQPQSSGLCLAYIQSYYYNVATDKCESFIYGGCNGNDNRFFLIEDCEKACKGYKIEKTDFKLILESDEDEIKSVENEDESVKDASESVKDESESVKDESESVKDESESVKDESRDVEKRSESATTICSLPAVPGPCRAFFPRFFFNGKECASFVYGGCKGNENNFRTVEDCKQKCASKSSEVHERSLEKSENTAVSEEELQHNQAQD